MAGEDKLDKIIGHLDDLHKKCDSINGRLDTIDTEHKKDRAEVAASRANADAEEAKGREEKQKADAARGAPRADATGENRNAFAGSQMRLDSATQAWGHQCRAPLAGESLRDYRISVLNGLKAHSKAYKDSDLATIGDENAFTNIEGMIINDAIEASVSNITAGAPLRKVTARDDMGRITSKFYGDPIVAWAPFMGGATRFGKFGNGRPAAH